MSTPASAIYDGTVSHRRVRPRRHNLSYRVFSLLLDLDELPALDRRLRLFGYNRPAALSFRDRDHGPGDGTPAAQWVRTNLRDAGLEAAGARILALTYPRMFGYVFNPLTIYYCLDEQDRPGAVLYEVSNTFGERHSYLLPIETGPGGRPSAWPVRQATDKAFYVSPFFDVSGGYRFQLSEPGAQLTAAVTHVDADGARLAAVFHGRKIALHDGALARMLLLHPLMTLKVFAGIHWEALKLWRKGLPLAARPEPPAQAVSVGGQRD